MEPFAIQFGEFVRKRRTLAGFTQKRLAESAGLNQVQIARLEAGRGNPRMDTVIQVLRSLGFEWSPVPIHLMPVLNHLMRVADGEAVEPTTRLVGNDPEDWESGDDL